VSRKRKPRRRPSKAARRRQLRWISVGLVVLIAIAWIWLGAEVRQLSGVTSSEPKRREDSLRVVSWNIANFEGDPAQHDLARIREVIERLDPDVLALQEIKRGEALTELLPDWDMVVSERGGRGHQKLVIAWRRDRVTLLASEEHPQLSLGGRVRPGLSGYLRGRDGGPDFWLVVVHLKAMPSAIDLRREQWPQLLEIVEGLVGRGGPGGVGKDDRDLLIVGDFNSTGPPGGQPAIEHRELELALGPIGLRRLPSATGCTAYYDGQRRDAWKEPSEIDLIWARDLAESLRPDAQVFSGTHCASSRCRDFRSTTAYPVRDFERVSDHCPVVVDLLRADDD
jgi:endonuclease/exonuclease/phosphatase family metal-dependent hydrolase